MSRSDRVYDKPPVSVDEMIDLLESRNLQFPDKERAAHYLRYINYYRISGYGYLFEEEHVDGNRSHRFRDGTSFDNLLDLYVFDRHLRLLVMDAIERIEVGVRTVIAHELSLKYGNGQWLLDKELFVEKGEGSFTHAGLIRSIKMATAYNATAGTDKHKSREPFIAHYYEHYDYPPYPPAWMLTEVLTLGTWSKIYTHLRVSGDRKRIARVFDLSPAELESWLHSLTYLRNLCAHHSQIYGRRLAFPPKNKPQWPELPRKAFARFIAIIEYMLRRVAPDTQWGDKVRALIEEESLVNPERLGIHGQYFWECEL